MSYDYDDEDDGAGRVLWGRIGVFLITGLLLFLLGRACAPDGISQTEFDRVSAQASELQLQRDEALQRLAQGGGGGSEPTGDTGTEAESGGGEDPTEDATADSPDSETEEETEEDSGEGSGDTYIVEAGDTLNEIAARFDVDPDDLADANGIDDPSDLVVGQELEIP